MKLKVVAWAVFTKDNELYYELGKNFLWPIESPHAEDNAVFMLGTKHAKELGLCAKQLAIVEEYSAETLDNQRIQLLDHVAKVALAIEASGRPVHQDFIEVLKMLPTEIRRCPDCGGLDSSHYQNCKIAKK